MKKLIAFIQAHLAPTAGTVTGTIHLGDLVRSIGTAVAAGAVALGFSSGSALLVYLIGMAQPFLATGITATTLGSFAGALILDLLRRFVHNNPTPPAAVVTPPVDATTGAPVPTTITETVDLPASAA